MININAYKTNVIDNRYRGYTMTELNRLKDCYLNDIKEIDNDKTLTDSEYFESTLIAYEKLSELKELIIYALQESTEMYHGINAIKSAKAKYKLLSQSEV